MPQFRLNGDKFLLQPDPGTISSSYFIELASDFDKFLETKRFADVTIWCNDGQLSTHKIMLATKSRLLSAIFQDNSSSSDIICPDFSIKLMTGFIKILYTGFAVVGEDPDLHQINAIIKTLGAPVELSASPLEQLNLGGGEVPELEDEIDPLESSSNDEVDTFSDESLSDIERFENLTMPEATKTRKCHSKAPSLECPECGKAFGMQIALHKHCQRSHQANVTATSDEPSANRCQETLIIECSVCEEFVSSSDLEHHSKTCRKPEKAPQSK